MKHLSFNTRFVFKIYDKFEPVAYIQYVKAKSGRVSFGDDYVAVKKKYRKSPARKKVSASS